jgi:hypothetical protein
MERRGERSDRGDINREIEQQNADRRALKGLEGNADDLRADLALGGSKVAAAGIAKDEAARAAPQPESQKISPSAP